MKGGAAVSSVAVGMAAGAAVSSVAVSIEEGSSVVPKCMSDFRLHIR